jgi:tetratricopeptide (TPR) repeat protein
LAKQQRRSSKAPTTKTRPVARKKAAKAKTRPASRSADKGRVRAAAKSATKAVSRPPVRAAVRASVKTAKPPIAAVKATAGVIAPVEAPTPPPAVRKPGFYEAVAIYERGVQALQRHDYIAAADQFRVILDKYPEERELLERARLYLRVCERETARQPAGPKTPAERVYAATVALNSGDHAGALDQLQRALTDDPESDHAHYTMAVALGMRGRVDEALGYLRNAIGLNPDNRGLARQDPDLESVRGHDSFLSVLDTPAMSRRRSRPRR